MFSIQKCRRSFFICGLEPAFICMKNLHFRFVSFHFYTYKRLSFFVNNLLYPFFSSFFISFEAILIIILNKENLCCVVDLMTLHNIMKKKMATYEMSTQRRLLQTVETPIWICVFLHTHLHFSWSDFLTNLNPMNSKSHLFLGVFYKILF